MNKKWTRKEDILAFKESGGLNKKSPDSRVNPDFSKYTSARLKIKFQLHTVP